MSKFARLGAAAEHLQKIEGALTRLKAANAQLDLANEYVRRDQVWTPTLQVGRRSWYPYEVEMKVPVSGELIVQTAINEVVRCRRELNLLGYDGPVPQPTKPLKKT